MAELFLTTSEIAERFGVSIQAVNLWIRAGYFPHAIRGPKSGRGYTHLVPEQDVIGFVPRSAGRPADPDPSPAALAQRRSRARRRDTRSEDEGA